MRGLEVRVQGDDVVVDVVLTRGGVGCGELQKGGEKEMGEGGLDTLRFMLMIIRC